MERVSTLGLPAAGRMAAWNDLYSSRMSRVEFTPGDQHRFDVHMGAEGGFTVVIEFPFQPDGQMTIGTERT